MTERTVGDLGNTPKKTADAIILMLEDDKEIIDGEDFENFEYTPEEERKLVRKLDLYVLPLLCCVFFTQYLDKTVISYTVVFGLESDLNLKGSQYSWLTSSFSIAQLVSQIWNIFALSKFPVKTVVGISILLWGSMCMIQAAANDFTGLLVIRLFLAFFEGAVSPAFVIITSLYYKKSEHSLRTGAWISCNALAQLLGAYLVYGIARNGSLSLPVWKVTFIICGAVTLFFGIVFQILIPLSPIKAWFLNDRERKIAIARLLEERDGGESSSFSIKQLIEAFKLDWITICSFLFGFLITVTSGPIIFSTLYLAQMGYANFEVIEYGSPSSVIQLGVIWLGILLTKLFPKQRCFCIVALVTIPLAGNILLLALPETNNWGNIIGSWLGSCISGIMNVLLSLNASNLRGNTRKAIVNNLFFLGYCLAAIVYPQWWNYSTDPRFRKGVISDIVLWGVFCAVILFYRYACIYENRKRDKRGYNEGQLVDCKDKSDKEDLNHRYSY